MKIKDKNKRLIEFELADIGDKHSVLMDNAGELWSAGNIDYSLHSQYDGMFKEEKGTRILIYMKYLGLNKILLL